MNKIITETIYNYVLIEVVLCSFFSVSLCVISLEGGLYKMTGKTMTMYTTIANVALMPALHICKILMFNPQSAEFFYENH